MPQFQGDSFSKNLRTIERIREVGLRYGKSPSQVAIKWVLQHPAISCTIIGAKTPHQVQDNLGALGWVLAPCDYEYLANEPQRPPEHEADRAALRSFESSKSLA
jgi:aryl-alcohol dehydrogenase-like predicted oxidoreductase